MATVGFVKQIEFRFQAGNRLKAHEWFSSAQGFCVLVTHGQKNALLTQGFNVSQVRKGSCNHILYHGMFFQCMFTFLFVPKKCWMKMGLPRIWEKL